jgi:hypothetical protein
MRIIVICCTYELLIFIQQWGLFVYALLYLAILAMYRNVPAFIVVKVMINLAAKQLCFIWLWIRRMIYCGLTRFSFCESSKKIVQVHKTFTYIIFKLQGIFYVSCLVANHFNVHFRQMERQCCLISIYK